MKRLLTFALLVTASLAWASPDADAKSVVEKELVKPLAAKEAKRSRFSRAYQPPMARRVRVLEEKSFTDSKGATFMTFSVDQMIGWGDELLDPEVEAATEKELKADPEKKWRKDVIVGCVYPEANTVFVKRGDKLYPSGLLLGKKLTTAEAHLCVPSDEQVAAR